MLFRICLREGILEFSASFDGKISCASAAEGPNDKVHCAVDRNATR